MPGVQATVSERRPPSGDPVPSGLSVIVGRPQHPRRPPSACPVAGPLIRIDDLREANRVDVAEHGSAWRQQDWLQEIDVEVVRTRRRRVHVRAALVRTHRLPVEEETHERAAIVERRTAPALGFEVFSLGAGRRIRSTGWAPRVTSARLNRRAPVRPLRMLLL